jgi:hypothetical protein
LTDWYRRKEAKGTYKKGKKGKYQKVKGDIRAP